MQLLPIQQLLVLGELQVIHGAYTQRQQLAFVKEAVLLWRWLHTQSHTPSIVRFIWKNCAIGVEAYGPQPFFAVLWPEHLQVRWPVNEVA